MVTRLYDKVSVVEIGRQKYPLPEISATDSMFNLADEEKAGSGAR
jgi:hypothetical protein